MTMQSSKSFTEFLRKIRSEEKSPLSDRIILHTLDLGGTGSQSITEYLVADEEIWKRVSFFFRESLKREHYDYVVLCERVGFFDKLFYSRCAPQSSIKALDLVMSARFRIDYECWAIEENLKFLHLPENASLLEAIHEACDKNEIDFQVALENLIVFDWHIGCAMKQAICAPDMPIEGEPINWVQHECAIKQAACAKDDENPRLTPALLYATLKKSHIMSASKKYLFAQYFPSSIGDSDIYYGVQNFSCEFVEEVEKIFRLDDIPFQFITGNAFKTGFVIHKEKVGQIVRVELPEKCGNTCAFLLRGVLFISVCLSSKKKDLGKPGQENFEDQYEELMEFCKSYPARVLVGNFEHDITDKIDGFEYGFPNCEHREDTVRYFRTDMQTLHSEANTSVKMKKDFILVSCPGKRVDIFSEGVGILGDESLVSEDAYLPHLQHPMPHLQVGSVLFIRNGPTGTVTKMITGEASASKETSK